MTELLIYILAKLLDNEQECAMIEHEHESVVKHTLYDQFTLAELLLIQATVANDQLYC